MGERRVVKPCESCGRMFQAAKEKTRFCPKCAIKITTAAGGKWKENLPKCPICGRGIKNLNETGLCYRCKISKFGRPRVEVICPKCGNARLLRKNSVLQNGFQPLCEKCRPIPRVVIKPKKDRIQKPLKLFSDLTNLTNVLHIGGCTLVPAWHGRCRHFLGCIRGSHAGLYVDRANDCAWQVAKLNWPGFKTLGKCYPIYAPDSLSLLTDDRPSCQALCLEV